MCGQSMQAKLLLGPPDKDCSFQAKYEEQSLCTSNISGLLIVQDSLCTYIYMYIYMYIYTYIYICIFVFAYLSRHVCICLCVGFFSSSIHLEKQVCSHVYQEQWQEQGNNYTGEA
jgi:hypothetical protein